MSDRSILSWEKTFFGLVLLMPCYSIKIFSIQCQLNILIKFNPQLVRYLLAVCWTFFLATSIVFKSSQINILNVWWVFVLFNKHYHSCFSVKSITCPIYGFLFKHVLWMILRSLFNLRDAYTLTRPFRCFFVKSLLYYYISFT